MEDSWSGGATIVRMTVENPPALVDENAGLSALARAALRALFGVGLVLDIGVLVARSNVDLPVTAAFNSLHVGIVGAIATGIYAAVEPQWALLIVLAIAAILWRVKGDLKVGLRFAVAVGGTWLPVIVLKLLVHRPRPGAALLPHPSAAAPGDWSFPSGHTAFITALVLVLVLALGRARRSWTIPAAVLAVAVMGSVVLIDGFHFPTDVLASIIWSASLAHAAWELSARLIDHAGVPRR